MHAFSQTEDEWVKTHKKYNLCNAQCGLTQDSAWHLQPGRRWLTSAGAMLITWRSCDQQSIAVKASGFCNYRGYSKHPPGSLSTPHTNLTHLFILPLCYVLRPTPNPHTMMTVYIASLGFNVSCSASCLLVDVQFWFYSVFVIEP